MKKEYTQKWTIAAFFNKFKVGYEYPSKDTPVHVTIVGTFSIDKNGDELTNIIIKSLVGERSIKIIGRAIDYFGPKEDIKVTRVNETIQLHDLHNRLFKSLSENKARFDSPEYQGSGYSPHCTYQPSGYLQENHQIIIKDLCLVDMFPNNDHLKRKIHSRIKLLNEVK